ncbi:unnamed protein product [Urochloa humidicola]
MSIVSRTKGSSLELQGLLAVGLWQHNTWKVVQRVVAALHTRDFGGGPSVCAWQRRPSRADRADQPLSSKYWIWLGTRKVAGHTKSPEFCIELGGECRIHIWITMEMQFTVTGLQAAVTA